MSVQDGARLTYGVPGHDAVQRIPVSGKVVVTCECGESWTRHRKTARQSANECQRLFRKHCDEQKPSLTERW